jgi:hypothetical protein
MLPAGKFPVHRMKFSAMRTVAIVGCVAEMGGMATLAAYMSAVHMRDHDAELDT